MEERYLLSWTTMEYEHTEKTSDWFWALGIATGAIAVAAAIFGNVLFSLLIILAAGTLAYFNKRKPELITIQITTRGIKIKNEFFLYKDLKCFAFLTEDGKNDLRILSSRFFMPIITIPLGSMSETEIRTTLALYLEEKELNEHTAEKLAGMLKL